MKNILADLLERHRRFDDVGRETDESLELADAVVTQEKIVRSEKLASLENNQGWKLVKAEMISSIEKHKELLIHCLNDKEIVRIQEFIKTRTQLLNWISNLIEEGKSFLEESKNQGPTLVGQPKE